jgi:hypothetical protein
MDVVLVGVVVDLELRVRSCGIPHLAKNERDVGHPGFLVWTEGLTVRIGDRWSESDRWGFAHHFRPTYALANVGHPSSF